MSTKRIRWIVALMAVGLLGLVGFQLYWISNALQLQKEQFDYKVTDALQEVVRTLERQEILYLTRQRIQAQDQQQQLMAIAKKAGTPDAGTPAAGTPEPRPVPKPARPAEPAPERTAAAKPDRAVRKPVMPSGAVTPSDALHPTVQPLTAEQVMVVEQFFRQQEELMAVGDWQTQLEQQQQFDIWIDHVLAEQMLQLNQQLHGGGRAVRDSGANRVTTPPRKIRRKLIPQPETVAKASTPPSQTTAAGAKNGFGSADQSQLIKDVLKGFLMSDRPIEERVNRQALDTLLRQALEERGIGIAYDYGVRTNRNAGPRGVLPGRSSFLFTSRQLAVDQFEKAGYKAALFPNNILETGNYIYLYFPEQQQFILSRMGVTLAGSAVLILVIMACFYIAISTIVRQKKLADIKNDFINNMTHEFKTPISTISLAVEMAENTGLGNGTDAEATGRLARYMGIIRDETRRLGSHVEKVLQMALLDRGEIKLKLTEVNVHDVIDKVLNNIGLQIEQREGEIDLEFDAQHELVQADDVHLTNIVYNLVDNAIKYSPDKPHITIRTRNTGADEPVAGVVISVTDRGLGMTKEQLGRIFEKFYRVPTGNRHDVKGFGLGLSYVQKMVEAHHGQIHVQSQPGKGSTFDMVIPFKMSE